MRHFASIPFINRPRDLSMSPSKSSSHRRNYNEPGHAHELTWSCYKRFQFLKTDRVCQWLAGSIAVARVEFNFDVWAYVSMPEHLHLIIRPRSKVYDIADIRQALKAPVASSAIEYLEREAPSWLPRISRLRAGNTERLFWQPGGGFDRNITEPSTLFKMIDYAHLNPVRRGLVIDPADWKWSSAGWFLRMEGGPIPLDPIPPEWANA